MKDEKFDVTGMTCAACQVNVEKAVRRVAGVSDVSVSLLARQMRVRYDEQAADAARIAEAVQRIGYGASLSKDAETPQGEDSYTRAWARRRQKSDDETRALRNRVALSAVFLVPLMMIGMGGMLGMPLPLILAGEQNMLISAFTQFLFALPVLIVNRSFFDKGVRALLHRAPNMDSLVSVGAAASILYGVFALYMMMYGLGHDMPQIAHHYAHQLYFESAAMILTLVTLGKYLEARAKGKTSDALDKLIQLAPQTVTAIREGHEVTLPVREVVMGDILVLRPGERLAVDGVVTEGHGFLDQAAVTGESLPVEKNAGDEVISATLVANGTFRMRAEKVGENTTIRQIIRLVDEAGQSKAPMARMADRVSGVFVPVVMGVALVTVILWLALGQSFEFALTCAVAVLVISCPCALGLATPVAIMAGTGVAAEHGILVKSAGDLEALHAVDTVVLDKTGTVTSGVPAVTDVAPWDATMDAQTLLALAAAAEAGSEHPLAEAVVRKANEDRLDIPQSTAFDMRPGRGVQAVVDGKTCRIGNRAWLQSEGYLSAPMPDDAEALAQRFAGEGKTPLLVAWDGRFVGIIAVADTVRDTSADAIARLRAMGLRVVMLTGDNRQTAETIAKSLSIDEVVPDVLPAQKEAHIRALQAKGHKTAMVGDGINDAPALTAANVGIAIGAGTDIAVDCAGIVLMQSSLLNVVTAIELSRRVVRNIRQNLFWAFFYNALGIPVAAGVLYPAFHITLSPMLGAAAMSLSSICVVSNALRLRGYKPSIPNNSAPPKTRKDEFTMEKTIMIEGMMCAHCQAHVEKALAAVAHVKAVQVDLKRKQAVVTLDGDVPDSELMDAVRDAGYSPIRCD